MSNLLTVDVIEALKPFPGRNLLITAGNEFRHDDGVGPYIFSHLTSTPRLWILNAGFRPEDIIMEAVSCNPDKIIIIDAADFGASPGDIRIIDENVITSKTLSTHTVPLSAVVNLITMDTEARVVYIGIQAADISFGEGLSFTVKNAADILLREIEEAYHA